MEVLPASMGYEDEAEIDDTEAVLKEEDFCEYAYDFENNELLLDKEGKHYYVYGNEAIKIWIYKATLTHRFHFSAYSDRFGTELFDLIGEVISSDFKKEEIKRYIIESIIVHPYITEVEKVDVKQTKAKAIADVYYKTIFSNEIEEVSCQIQII